MNRRCLYRAARLFCLAVALLGGQTLRIYHIDVEQGDATLFVAPAGKTLLVDSGKNGHGPRLQAVMAQAAVNQIDFFVNTHYHEDHYGGIDDLVEAGVPVLRSFDRGDKAFLPASKLSEATFKDYQRTVGEDATPLRRGMTLDLDPAMTVTCISSGGVVIGEAPPAPGKHENDMSVSLLITFGGFQYFVGGDIESTTEAKIAARDLVLNVDVYQANHHGSHTSSTRAFMEDLSPRVIVVSNGNNSTYKHPRRTTLDLYASLPQPPVVFQTNKYLQGGLGGNVPDAFIADLKSTNDNGTILLTVNLDSTSYQVSYGIASHTFPIKNIAAASTVVIHSLLPNPAGPDDILEEVTLRNKGTAAVSLTGWTLRDRSGLTWSLSTLGVLAPGELKTIRRNNMPMSLNNGGDEITLLDAANAVRDSFTYTSSTEGVVIQTLH
jgi:competence protein ComEC